MTGNSKCKICGAPTFPIHNARIMGKYYISFFICNNCGFMQTEEPYWLEEAYKNPINVSDTGYMQRNIAFSKILTTLLTVYFNPRRKFVDYGGGYGVFVRLMRDIGFDFYWYDKFTPNLFAKGFEWNGTDKVEAVTAFELLEHLADPLVEIEKMISISKNVIFSTFLLPDPVPKPDEWWYYGLDHGQHISFYSQETLAFIAGKYDLSLHDTGRNIYLITPKTIPGRELRILSRLSRYVFPFLADRRKSKTLSDMEYLKSMKGRLNAG